MAHYVDMTYFINREYHETLTKIGKLPWVSFVRNEIQGRPATTVKLNKELLKKYPDMNRLLWQFMPRVPDKDQASFCLAILTLSRLFANGPKLFQPDHDTCLALENIDVNITFPEYRQPYPALIIKFPDSYVEHVHRRFPDTTRFHTLTVLLENGLLHIHQIGSDGEDEACISTTVNTLGYDGMMEEFLVDHEDASDYHFVEYLQRIAINLCLLATHCGTRVQGPLDRHALKRSRKAQARFGFGDIHQVVLNKPIKLFRTETLTGPKEHGGGTHSSPVSHWRRGHWRMQAHGPNYSLRKLKFIECVLVRMGHDDVPHSSYVMKGVTNG